MATAERRLGPVRRGMTVLGKVPIAPKPINLPSQKLERWGADSDIEIVPRGTSCWGSNGRTPAVENNKAVNGDEAPLAPRKVQGESSDNDTEGSTETSTRPSSAESDMPLSSDPGMTTGDSKASVKVDKEEEQEESTGPTPNSVELSAPGSDEISDPGPEQTASSDHLPASSNGTFADKSKPSIPNHLGAGGHCEGPEQEGHRSSEGVYGSYPPFGKQGPIPSGSGFYSFTPPYDGFYCPPHYSSMKDREMVIVAMVGSPGFFGGYLHPAHPEHYGRPGFYGSYPLPLEHFGIPTHHGSSRGGPASFTSNGFIPERSDFFYYEGEGYSESAPEYKRNKNLSADEIQFGTWRGVSELGTSEMPAGVATDVQKHSFFKPSRKNRDGSSGARPRDYSRRTSKVDSSSRMPAPDKPFILLTKAPRSEGQSLNVVNLVLEDIQGSGNGQLASLTSAAYSRESVGSRDSPKLDSGGPSSRNAIIIDEILDANLSDAKLASSSSSNKDNPKVGIVDLSLKDINTRNLKEMADVEEPPLRNEGVGNSNDLESDKRMQIDAVMAESSEEMKVEQEKVEQLSVRDVKTRSPAVKDPDINLLSSNKDLPKENIADSRVSETVNTDRPSLFEKARSANSCLSTTMVSEKVKTDRPFSSEKAESADLYASITLVSETVETDRPSLSKKAESTESSTLVSETVKTDKPSSCEMTKSAAKFSAFPDVQQRCPANLKLKSYQALPEADGNKLKGRKGHKRVFPNGGIKPASALDQVDHDSQSSKGISTVETPIRDDHILKLSFNIRKKEREWRPKSPLVNCKAEVPAPKTQVCKDEVKVSPSQKKVIDGKDEALFQVDSSDTQCAKPTECQKAKKRLKEKEKVNQRNIKAHAKVEEISDDITKCQAFIDEPSATDFQQRTRISPRDVSCEDIEVDKGVSFLDDYVQSMLAKGAKPYIPAGEGLERGGIVSQHDVHDANVNPSLRFDSYKMPKPPIPVASAPSSEVIDHRLDKHGTLTLPAHYQSSVAVDVDNYSSGSTRLWLDGVQKKWRPRTYNTASSSGSQETTMSTPSRSDTEVNSHRRDNVSRSFPESKYSKKSTSQPEISPEKQKLVASPFGGNSSQRDMSAKASRKTHASAPSSEVIDRRLDKHGTLALPGHYQFSVAADVDNYSSESTHLRLDGMQKKWRRQTHNTASSSGSQERTMNTPSRSSDTELNSHSKDNVSGSFPESKYSKKGTPQPEISPEKQNLVASCFGGNSSQRDASAKASGNTHASASSSEVMDHRLDKHGTLALPGHYQSSLAVDVDNYSSESTHLRLDGVQKKWRRQTYNTASSSGVQERTMNTPSLSDTEVNSHIRDNVSGSFPESKYSRKSTSQPEISPEKEKLVVSLFGGNSSWSDASAKALGKTHASAPSIEVFDHRLDKHGTLALPGRHQSSVAGKTHASAPSSEVFDHRLDKHGTLALPGRHQSSVAVDVYNYSTRLRLDGVQKKWRRLRLDGVQKKWRPQTYNTASSSGVQERTMNTPSCSDTEINSHSRDNLSGSFPESKYSKKSTSQPEISPEKQKLVASLFGDNSGQRDMSAKASGKSHKPTGVKADGDKKSPAIDMPAPAKKQPPVAPPPDLLDLTEEKESSVASSTEVISKSSLKPASAAPKSQSVDLLSLCEGTPLTHVDTVVNTSTNIVDLMSGLASGRSVDDPLAGFRMSTKSQKGLCYRVRGKYYRPVGNKPIQERPFP